MDPITAGALITAGTNIGSTLLGGSIANANTGKQIAFEKWKMANAHQMEIRDLEAAGLNPVLSAGGSGASAGSITPQMPDTSGIANAGNAIFQAITAKNATNATNADVSLKKSQETNTDVDTTVKAAQAGLTDANTAKTIIETKIKEAEAEKAKQRIQAELEKTKIEIEETKQKIRNLQSEKQYTDAKKEIERLNALNYDLKLQNDMLKNTYRDWETDRKSTRLNSSH